uniref:Uncharacterized protein n=1 Tax=Auxenochlorella protothecoides TaxID=3075 RepID=A0A1D2A4L7_AUXPR
MSVGFLPPGALEAELDRCKKLEDEARRQQERAAREVQAAQDRLDLARLHLTTCASQCRQAREHRDDVDAALQAAKVLAAHFAAVWESRERQLPQTLRAIREAEGEERDARKAIAVAEGRLATAVEEREAADDKLVSTSRVIGKVRSKASVGLKKFQDEVEEERLRAQAERLAATAAVQKAQQVAAASLQAAQPAAAAPQAPAGNGAPASGARSSDPERHRADASRPADDRESQQARARPAERSGQEERRRGRSPTHGRSRSPAAAKRARQVEGRRSPGARGAGAGTRGRRGGSRERTTGEDREAVAGTRPRGELSERPAREEREAAATTGPRGAREDMAEAARRTRDRDGGQEPAGRQRAGRGVADEARAERAEGPPAQQGWYERRGADPGSRRRAGARGSAAGGPRCC